MYRQHLKLVLARDIESNRPKSEFVHRIASIPVVYLAWNIAAETYNTIKSSHTLLKTSLSTTEKAAYYVSVPFLRTFEKQLKSVDHVACKGLETLQEIVPNILHRKEKIYRHARNLYDDIINSGLKKYQLVKQLGTSKVIQLTNDGNDKLSDFLASPYGEVCEVALDLFLEAGEMYVDHYLPPLGDERPEKLFGDRGKAPASKRAELLQNRLKERFYKHTLLKFQMIKLKTKLLLIRIYRINIYEYLVETSSLVPELFFSTFVQVFTSIQDLISYVGGAHNTTNQENQIVV